MRVASKPLWYTEAPSSIYIYSAYVSEVAGNLYQTTRTCSLKLIAYQHLHNQCNNKIRSVRGRLIYSLHMFHINNGKYDTYIDDIDLCNVS